MLLLPPFAGKSKTLREGLFVRKIAVIENARVVERGREKCNYSK